MGVVNCKLGDGFDPELFKLTEFNGEPLNIKTENYNLSEIDVFEISATRLIHFHLGRYLEESFLRMLDFWIINDDQKYYNFMLTAKNKKEKCDEFRKHPENTGYHINELRYGIQLDVILPKTSFPDTEDEMRRLLQSALKNINGLTEEQKKVKCKVLINTTETRTMTLEQVFRFNDEFMNQNQHQEYQQIVSFRFATHKELNEINVINVDDFSKFLTRLYTCYRKIELKLEKYGYSLTEVKREKHSTVISCNKNLQSAKNEFKKMNKFSFFWFLTKTDFMKMYPVMKNLFYKYLDYLEFFIDHRLDMEEGDNLPMKWGDIQPWLKKLNNWEPDIRNNQNRDLLIYPSASRFIKQFFFSFKRYKSIKLKLDDKITEPLITLKDQHRRLFGIIKIRNPSDITENVTTATILDLPCPMKCSKEKRIWFCYICGEIVKIQGGYTICDCGQEILNRNEMTCNHPIHQEDVLIKQLPSDLRSIVYQLKKYEDDSTQIRETVTTIIDKHDDNDLMKELIQNMNNLNFQFDGDTKHLFNKFLK